MLVKMTLEICLNYSSVVLLLVTLFAEYAVRVMIAGGNKLEKLFDLVHTTPDPTDILS